MKEKTSWFLFQFFLGITAILLNLGKTAAENVILFHDPRPGQLIQSVQENGFFLISPIIISPIFSPLIPILPLNGKLVVSVLPTSRSVQVGNSATAFATIINSGISIALGCTISPSTNVPAAFVFQTTDPATNVVTGTANTSVDIPAGELQSFVIAFTPTASFAPTNVELTFDCSNTDPAENVLGLNTLLLSASTNLVPDIVALAVTISSDGIVNIPGSTRTGLFVLATVNVGDGGTITASADTGSVSLPINLLICETDPTSGACLPGTFPVGNVTTEIEANATPTFTVFVESMGNVPFDPATNRIFVRFRDIEGTIRGTTSVAVQTQ